MLADRSILATLILALAGCSRGSSDGRPAPGRGALSGTPCGDLECAQYPSAREAFLDVLAAGSAPAPPLVLAVGEAHAPFGATAPSAAKRFTDDMLPALGGRASDLLLELMMPPAGCTDAVAEARRATAPITSQHSEEAPNEYVAMGDRARPLGIVPDMLRPTCADMAAIEHAGDDLVDVSLSTIARLAGAQGARLADRDDAADADRGKMVVLYGGALHNDLAPPEEAARWSYAPALDAHVHGRLLALDLVVPEFIGGGPGGPGATWTSLPWWPAYDALRKDPARYKPDLVTVFRTGRQSFVLVFPEKNRRPPP